MPVSAAPLARKRRPYWRRVAVSWNRFWFARRDPTVLALMRWCCGALTCYTIFAYSFGLQEFIGANAWLNVDIRMGSVQGRPNSTVIFSKINPLPHPTPAPTGTAEEERWAAEYKEAIGLRPPAPHPRTQSEADYCIEYRKRFGIDLRYFGLHPPRHPTQTVYLERMTKAWRVPPGGYPLMDVGSGDPTLAVIDPDKAAEVEAYMRFHRADPYLNESRGITAFSIWFHVTDPTAQAVWHWLFVLVSFLFTIGLFTRFTGPATWFAALCYIHRSPASLFGVDTMMIVLLMYLMISPCGAVWSVDRWLQGHGARVKPTVSANFVTRLFQVHLCWIYLIAGCAKFLGDAWWRGTAVWNTMNNFEYAPMNDWYLGLIRLLCANQYVFETVMTIGTIGTLAFELSYAFLVWRPWGRPWILGGALFLHGLIGVFMSLRTFSLMMLTLNLIFLRPDEVKRLARRLGVR